MSDANPIIRKKEPIDISQKLQNIPEELPLNEEQQKAYDEIMKFIFDYEDMSGAMYCLKGYAGSGKTFLISRVIRDVRKIRKNWNIAMTAPTNKAVQVLKEASNIRSVSYRTIHSLLGLKEVIKESGQIDFEPDKQRFGKGDAMKDLKVLILDEVSMLDDKLFLEIKRYNKRVKIILMGDPAQIPPINKIDCEPFLHPKKHNIKGTQLTTIMRQADGSKIVEVAQEIRDNLATQYFDIEDGNDLTIRDSREERKEIKADFEKLFTKDYDGSIRVLAYTNDKVKEYNNYVRSLVYGKKSAKLNVGEILIMDDPFETIDKSYPLSTNQEVKVIEFEVFEQKITEQHKFKVYKTLISFIDSMGQPAKDYIEILHEDSEKAFNKLLDEMAAAAKVRSLTDKERTEKWRNFYTVKRHYANVLYAYSMTVHKSQGSTFDTCFVDVKNICINERIVERNRILYTAVTRPKNKLILIA